MCQEWTTGGSGRVPGMGTCETDMSNSDLLSNEAVWKQGGHSPHWFVIGARRRITHCGECPRACSPERGTCVGPKSVMYAFRADRRRHSFPTAGPGCRVDSTPGRPLLLGTTARICSLSPLAPPAKERTQLAAKPAAPASGPEALLELKKDQPLPSLPSPARALIL